MNDSSRRATLVIQVILALGLVSCSHRLEIKNLAQYKVSSINPLVKRISIGIVSSDADFNVKRLLHEVGTELQKYSSEVHFPYTQNSQRKVDLIADIRIQPTYAGSALNFLVNFPGFLVWAPAWHGYKYRVEYDINVDLMDPTKNERIDSFSVPISFNVRHAEMDRTWTELSWFEVGVLAFVGGIYSISYDHDVTPLVLENAGLVIGRHMASEIVSRINSSGRFAHLDESREKDLPVLAHK